MIKDNFKPIILQGQSFVNEIEIVERSLDTEENGNYVFVGMRRVGKSFLLYQIAKQMFSDGMSPESILYINFEDERLLEIETADFQVMLDAYSEMYDSQPVLFLDEIQIVPGWEKFARRMADSKYRVFITGSNADMLSSEIATTLGGRFLIKEVFPFSFNEYLRSNSVELEKNWQFKTEKQNEVIRHFNDYFYYGGLPEISQFKDKRIWLESLYQKIFFGDLISRYKIRNEFVMKLLIKKLAESVMQPMSFNRMANVVSSTGTRTTASTCIEYMNYLKASFLIFSLSNYADKLSERETNKKYYFRDNGILNLFLLRPETILLENLVASVLVKYYGDEVYFFKQKIEVDFYIPKQEMAIQVSYNPIFDATMDREIGALRKMVKHVPVKQMILITNGSEDSIEVDNHHIRILPAWKWLMEIESKF